jgi:hypothetical protein
LVSLRFRAMELQIVYGPSPTVTKESCRCLYVRFRAPASGDQSH